MIMTYCVDNDNDSDNSGGSDDDDEGNKRRKQTTDPAKQAKAKERQSIIQSIQKESWRRRRGRVSTSTPQGKS